MRESSMLVALVAVTTLPTAAQTLPLEIETRTHAIDSGYLHNEQNRARVVYATTVEEPGAAWFRLFLRDTNLPAGSRLRLTSELDGAVQHFDGRSLAEYGFGSAYFNGDRVKIELVAAPHTRANRLQIVGTELGRRDPPAGMQPDSICGPTDDRVLSSDPRIGRAVSASSACTWMLLENEFTVATAGHCTDPSGPTPWIIGFNIPLSNAEGTPIHPPPDDQYAVDLSSVHRLEGGEGADWAVMATVRNSNHGQYAGERQGAWFERGAVPAQVSGVTIRITGNGSVRPPIPKTWNAVPKTHTGPRVTATVNHTIAYQADTTGGNSGSPVIHEATGKMIGIHTNGGCSATEGNVGTRIDRPDLANAIDTVLASRIVGTMTEYGSGCAGTAGVPELSMLGNPDIGYVVRVQLDKLPVGQAGMLGVGISDTIWGAVPLPLDLDPLRLEGCTLHASLELTLGITTASGSTTIFVPLANDPSLIGGQVFFQAFVLDPGAPGRTVGASVTNAGALSIGG
ncbi:MAG: hypothetical protein AAF628_33855 [Planctomycetota bacterium]